MLLLLCCSALFTQVHDLPGVDYSDETLLEPDPDLMLQEGPDAIPFAVMKPFLEKWERLDTDKWCAAWRDLQVGAGSCAPEL